MALVKYSIQNTGIRALNSSGQVEFTIGPADNPGGNGGDLYVMTGDTDVAPSGSSGDVIIRAGYGGTLFGNAGSVRIIAPSSGVTPGTVTFGNKGIRWRWPQQNPAAANLSILKVNNTLSPVELTFHEPAYFAASISSPQLGVLNGQSIKWTNVVQTNGLISNDPVTGYITLPANRRFYIVATVCGVQSGSAQSFTLFEWFEVGAGKISRSRSDTVFNQNVYASESSSFTFETTLARDIYWFLDFANSPIDVAQASVNIIEISSK
nr:hypothetical protein [Sicyoidochytrium minutum DNA virus]